ncbi:LodA/GoxA family CTQ-dependent oxidase [Massilia sp. W12]|uniref:LodA/GoxA family CTQ-dependent oxidase n=1 Tax=Massilia sp. W12 TaxID=3126507 RepID=UPI0030CDDFA4
MSSTASTAKSKKPADTAIVRAAIHPAIGFARVGNSKTEHFIAQQVTEPVPKPADYYRDKSGALKREGVEFRIYGYNAAGEVVAELTKSNADITWSAHAVNRKAAWYQWQIAMDIPEAATVVLPRRNAKVLGPARQSLVIDGGVQTLSAAKGGSAQFVGNFTNVPVTLGEIRIIEEGRLLFLGGFGRSESPTGAPIYNPADGNSFINADDWFDDTSDGPIEAKVLIKGVEIPVDGAWVVTAPPNYAPQVKAERTLYDLLYDLYVRNGWMQAPSLPSFTHDIYPTLQRLTDLQWVNQGFLVGFGFGSQMDFSEPDLIARLHTKQVDGYDLHQEFRRQIFNSFRSPIQTDGNQMPWPWVYGDAMTVPAGDSPRQNSTITETQYYFLQRWVEGNFIDDWAEKKKPPTAIKDLPLELQPAMLDRAALDFALADAFHPGCELTWPMRHLTMYYKPFRIRRRAPGSPPTDYGKTLDQQQCLAVNGPLYEQSPGDLNRWMGLPWQGDTAWCRSGYQTTYDPFVPTFWPARVPNQVLSEADYKIVIDSKKPLGERLEAFNHRSDWNEALGPGTSTAHQMEEMVKLFGSMGLLIVMDGVKNSPHFPPKMMVATYGPGVQAPVLQAEQNAQAEGRERNLRSLPRGANFADHDDAEAAPLPGSRRR